MPKPPAIVDPLAWIQGKTLEDLKLVRYGRALLTPDAFRSRDEKGAIVAQPVLIRVPTDLDLDMARLDAIREVQRLARTRLGADTLVTTVDQARQILGAERFETLDTTAVVARCTHEAKLPDNPTDMPQQFMTLELMRTSFNVRQIYDVWNHMELLAHMLDPRLGEIDEPTFWAFCGAISKVENASPLGAMQGATQNDYVVEASKRLWRYRTSSSSTTSDSTSTPEL